MSAILIIAIAWFSSENDVPLGGAIFMTALVFLGGLLHSYGFLESVLWAAFTFIYCFIYFHVLNRCKDSIVTWMMVLFAGGVGWFLLPVYLTHEPAL